MKKYRKIIKQMEKRGWTAELTRKNHIRFTLEGTDEALIYAGTPSDHRAELNMKARAKRIEQGRQRA